MTGQTIEEVAVGAAAEMTREITVETIREFVDSTGDHNPLHSDPAFAATTRFGQVIAPGILTGGLLSAVIGTRLPGPGTVYLSQTFRFLKPVSIGDRITARVEVAEIARERSRLRVSTRCVNQNGETVLDGEAWVMPPQAHIEYPETSGTRHAWGHLTWGATALAAQAASLWAATGLAVVDEILRTIRPRLSQPS